MAPFAIQNLESIKWQCMTLHTTWKRRVAWCSPTAKRSQEPKLEPEMFGDRSIRGAEIAKSLELVMKFSVLNSLVYLFCVCVLDWRIGVFQSCWISSCRPCFAWTFMIIHCWSLASFNFRRPSIFVDFSSNFCTAFLKLFRRRFEAVVWQFSKLPHLRCRVWPPQNLGGRFTVWHHLCSRPQQLPFFLFELRFQIFQVPVFLHRTFVSSGNACLLAADSKSWSLIATLCCFCP